MSFFSPQTILNHLMEYIPRLSDRFTNNTVVEGYIIDGTPQTLRITEPAHGLTVGREVVLLDGRIKNPITAVELIADPVGGDVLRFTVTENHNLTEVYTPSVTLAGFTDSQFNGTFELVSVPSRLIFEISQSNLPTLTGGESLIEDWEVGINGNFIVNAVPSASTYEILLTDKPKFTPQTVPALERAVGGFNMGIAIDLKRAEALYTKQASDKSSLWLFVIMGDSAASKDRRALSDAIQGNTAGQSDRTLMINTFSILVIFPTDTETAGAEASQLAWEEIYQVMLASMSGVSFEDFGTSPFKTALIDHGSLKYNNSFYEHVYTFEYSYQVTQDQNYLTQFIESVPFRDNAISSNEADDGSNINLDDEPA
jgi:hypothetical protein